MQSDKPTHRVQQDEDIAREALAHLDLVEPSAALLRRVARIPLDMSAPQPSGPMLGSFWTRALLGAALGLGVVCGALPWGGEDGAGDTTDTELESTLSAALSSDWAEADAVLEESL